MERLLFRHWPSYHYGGGWWASWWAQSESSAVSACSHALNGRIPVLRPRVPLRGLPRQHLAFLHSPGGGAPASTCRLQCGRGKYHSCPAPDGGHCLWCSVVCAKWWLKINYNQIERGKNRWFRWLQGERGGGWDFFFLHFFTPLDKSWHLMSRVYPVIESSEVWHTYGTWGNFYPKSITVRSKLPGREKRPESRLSGSCPPCCLGACSSLFCFGKMEGLAGKSQNYIGAGWNRSQRPRKQHPRWCTFDSSFRFRERSFGGE